MTNASRRTVRRRQILPPLTLSAPTGARVDVPGNQATILIFTHPDGCEDCAGYLTEAGTVVGDVAAWATRIVGVLPAEGGPSEGLPFPVVIDADSTARSRLGIGEGDAAVLLMDRWGEVFEVNTFAAGDHDLPLPRQLVESSKIVDISCGECNVPSPEWRDSAD